MIKLGYEVFHASCVGTKNGAVGFLGESGYGKSTLAASFLKQGFPLLTDDVLAVRKKGTIFRTQPGVSQIKLFPAMAKKILKRSPAGKMSPIARKWILPLEHKNMGQSAYSIEALYVLWPRFKKGSSAVRIKKLKPQDAVISLIKSSHNLVLQDSKRLQRQMLFVSEMVKRVSVRAVSFPMDLKIIPSVVEKIQRDIKRVFARRQKPKSPTAARS